MVLEDAVESLEQAIVGGEQQVARADAASLGDDRFVLVRRQIGHLERLELGSGGLDLVHPQVVELVPVLEVVAGAYFEELLPARQGRFVGDRVRSDVDVAVQDPYLGPERRRHGEESRVRLVERDDRRLEDEGVERVQRLWGVQCFVEPEPALLEGPSSLAEPDVGRVELLPPLAAGGD